MERIGRSFEKVPVVGTGELPVEMVSQQDRIEPCMFDSGRLSQLQVRLEGIVR